MRFDIVAGKVANLALLLLGKRGRKSSLKETVAVTIGRAHVREHGRILASHFRCWVECSIWWRLLLAHCASQRIACKSMRNW